MSRPFLAMTALLLLPVVVFVAGARIMSKVSGRQTVSGQKPLNERFGYNTKDVDQYWGALDIAARRAEERFLELDIAFPVFYGMALVVSLQIASAMLGRPVHVAWLDLPVVVTVVADWMENVVQMDQLRRFIEVGEKGLEPGWIHVASTATIIKLLFFSISSLSLLALLVSIGVRSFKVHSSPASDEVPDISTAKNEL